MRPPRDFPPASRGTPNIRRPAVETAACTVASSTGGGSGRPSPACMYGNWYRKVPTSRLASSADIRSRNGCRMPAPAPWAITYSHRARGGSTRIAETRAMLRPMVNVSSRSTAGPGAGRCYGVKAVLEALQRAGKIGPRVEYVAQRVGLEPLQAGQGGANGELLDIELGADFSPRQRHGDRRAR